MTRLLYLTTLQGKVRALPRNDVQYDALYQPAREVGIPDGWRPLRQLERLQDDEEVMHYSILDYQWFFCSRADTLEFRKNSYARQFVLVRV